MITAVSITSIISYLFLTLMFRNSSRYSQSKEKNKYSSTPHKWHTKPVSNNCLRKITVVGILLLFFFEVGFPAIESSAANAPKTSQDIALKLTSLEKQWLKDHPVVELGIDPGFAPYEFFDENGNYQGIAADYVKLIEEMLGITMRVRGMLTWSEFIEKARKHEIDILPCVGWNKEREEYLLFTNSYLSFPRVVFSRKSGAGPKSEEELVRFAVGVQENSSHHGWIKEKGVISPILYPTAQEAMLALSNGEIHAVIGNLAAASYIIKQLNLENLKVAFPLPGGPKILAFGVRKDWPEMVSILNKALAAIPLERAMEIRRKWVNLEEGKSLAYQIKFTKEEAAWLKTHPQITVAVMNAWPPLNFTDGNGKSVGIGVDILELLAEKTGFNVKFVAGQFKNNLENVKNKNVDALMDVTPKPERETFLNFTSPYLTVPHVIVARRGGPQFVNEGQLKGKILALERGFGNNAYFKDNYPEVKIENYDSTAQCLAAVSKGQADAYAGNRAVAIYIISQELLNNLEVQGNLQQEASSVLAIGVRKDWSELASILHKALESMAPMEKQAILLRWIGDYDARQNNGGLRQLSLPPKVDFNQKDFLIRKLAVVFLILLAVIVATWFLKGRPKHLTIRETLFLVSFVFAGFFIAIAIFASTLLKAETDISKIEARKADSFNLALELKQSSDDLTRLARTFAVTGEPKYEQHFRLVLSIRDGKHPHPRELSHAYWDHVTAGVMALDESGETYSIEGKILELGISEDEKEKLAKAKKESDELTNLENIAMNALKGLYKDPEGNFTIEGQPDIEMARNLLHGETYHKAKSKIMEPLDEFFTLLEWRTTNELNLVHGRFQAIISIITVLTFITIGFAIYVFLLLQRKIIRPLAILEDGTRKIREGTYSHHININSEDEAGALAMAFNSMAKSIEEHTAGLKEAQEHFQQLLEAAPDAFIAVGTDGSILLANAQAEKMFGYTKEQMIGNQFDMLLPPHLKNIHETLYEKYLQNFTGESAEPNFDLQALHADGSLIPIEISASLIKTKRSIMAVISVRDITERKNAEQALAEAKEVAEAATKAKSDFLANMSHEIRTPMNAIIGMSHLASKTDLTPKQYDYISKIQLSANSLLGIINDILDFSKIEAGKLDMESSKFQLEDVLDNLANLIGIKAEEKGLDLLFNLEKGVPTALIGDPLRLGQILINLCNNAVKFSDRGAVIVSISSVEKKNDKVKLNFSVQDSGIGLTEEQKNKLFQSFSQADTSITRKYGGTGLGLSISKKLCEMMGGEILVKSVLGKGSTFSFTAFFGLHAAKSLPLIPSPDLRGKKVLIVDDNQASREILQSMLESMSFTVSQSVSGEEAIEDIMGADKKGKPFELVYMDWQMPGMNGIATSRKIRALSLSRQPRIIMVTAYGREDIINQSANLKLEGFLVKPVNRSLLFDTTMAAFGREKTKEYDMKSDKTKEFKALKDIMGARILLAEDNEINQQVAREILEQGGLVVEIANNGREVLEISEKHHYDAILMDIQMPEIDGIEATRIIRSRDSEASKIPIIAMTAHAMAKDREKSIDAGMNDHITKPITPDELFAALAKWIKHEKREIPGDLFKKSSREGQQAGNNALPQIPEIDIPSGLSRIGGNEKLYGSLLVKFCKDYADAAKQIKDALAHKDMQMAARLAHTVKGVAGNLGARSLQKGSEEIESALKKNDLENIDNLLDIFDHQINSIIEGLKDFIAREDMNEEINEKKGNGDPEKLKELLEKLHGFIEKAKPKPSKEIMTEIKQYSWPKELNREIVELEKLISKYSFKDGLPVVTSLLEKIKKVTL